MRYRIGGSCGERISQIAHISSNTTAAWQIFPPDICGGCFHQISFRLVAASATLCSLLEDHDLLVRLEWFLQLMTLDSSIFHQGFMFSHSVLLGSELSNTVILHVAEILQQFWGYQQTLWIVGIRKLQGCRQQNWSANSSIHRVWSSYPDTHGSTELTPQVANTVKPEPNHNSCKRLLMIPEI